jgi:hypothetical protein
MLQLVLSPSILYFRYSFVLFLKFVIRFSKGGNQRIAVFNTKRNGENVARMEDVKISSSIQADFLMWGD